MQLPLGFRFGGLACQIKPSGKPDLALIMTEANAVIAGVYTQNVICAASIDWNRKITPTGQGRAVIVNSGNANACTGEQGIADNASMAAAVAQQIQARPEQVAVLSTGVIGRKLPLDRVQRGIEQLGGQTGRELADFQAAATAILTTDQGPKTGSRKVSLSGADIQLAGMAKGAGMIGPNMATMLGVICTDACLTAEQAQTLIREAADRSFNRISVEGHTSTNDALLLIASGAAGKPLAGESLRSFGETLFELCIELAKQIPADGEGAKHLIEIRVRGAADDRQADQVCRAIAGSALVKTAITGGDPNWGRIVSAAGFCGAEMEPGRTRLEINGHLLFADGEPVAFEAPRVSRSIADNRETMIDLVIGQGPGTAVHWTSDLTVEYVRFNSEYTT